LAQLRDQLPQRNRIFRFPQGGYPLSGAVVKCKASVSKRRR
jgi:hypothetical protein